MERREKWDVEHGGEPHMGVMSYSGSAHPNPVQHLKGYS